MSTAQRSRRTAFVAGESVRGIDVRNAIATWIKERVETTCIVAQRTTSVTLTFRNKRGLPITDLQITEMEALVDSFNVHVERKLESVERGYVRLVEFSLAL